MINDIKMSKDWSLKNLVSYEEDHSLEAWGINCTNNIKKKSILLKVSVMLKYRWRCGKHSFSAELNIWC